MKLIRSTTPLSKQFRPTAIVLAVATLMMPSVMSQAGTTYKGDTPSYNKLGDLTIYQPSTQSNKPTLTLMLDKSGSMGGSVSFHEDETPYSKVNVYRAYEQHCTGTDRKGDCNKYSDKVYSYYHKRSDIPKINNLTDENKTVSLWTVTSLIGADNQVCLASTSSGGYAEIYNPIYEPVNHGVRLEYCLISYL